MQKIRIFIDADIGQGGDCVIRAGIGADDRAVAQVVVVAADVFEKLGVLAQYLGNVVERADVSDGGHYAASDKALASSRAADH
jgi:hypothetical protein